jgi:apolipoprotein D and lipocalin family protein
VIVLGSDYEYAVVSEPRRRYLWILARTPTLEREVMDPILERLKEKGFDLRTLQRSAHRDPAQNGGDQQ